MGHKYLEELENYDGEFWGLSPDSREPQWRQEQKEYGFDSTETWNLDSTFYLWLYERLRMYQDVTIVNLHYHTFDYKGCLYYQDELIEMMLERLRFCFSDVYDDFDESQYEYVHEIEHIWAIILPAMWW